MSSTSRLSFTEHPATVGETYAEHLQTAVGFSVRMIGGGLACLVHGFLPFLFEKTGSAAIRSLHERMITHRSRTATTASSPFQNDAPPDGVPCTRVS